eukprot:CAMPEP_0168492830 /NCGR_PEP_ID=MMETSP0228-20121227/70415_1 /TAXON_ID=133427 /ORGANISM="Protoceratium reticulatum, Strain CCCM 535 (=CCMP 1889)" /LENGTH=116 /DNA_ID=CAMNT_0008509613 /DNA_START=292 /DNA_END=638 /DNA_ORIENTATION=-
MERVYGLELQRSAQSMAVDLALVAGIEAETGSRTARQVPKGCCAQTAATAGVMPGTNAAAADAVADAGLRTAHSVRTPARPQWPASGIVFWAQLHRPSSEPWSVSMALSFSAVHNP